MFAPNQGIPAPMPGRKAQWQYSGGRRWLISVAPPGRATLLSAFAPRLTGQRGGHYFCTIFNHTRLSGFQKQIVELRAFLGS